MIRDKVNDARVVTKMNLEEKMGRGRPNKRWTDEIVSVYIEI